MAWAACQCGEKRCNSQDDCASSEVCNPAGICVPDNGDGGDGGGGGNDAGDAGDGGQDSGTRPCVNLECRQVTCPGGGTTRLTGSVYDPSGQVALYNAIVYVPNSALQPLPNGVTCDQCGSLVTGNPVAITLTGPDGKFELDNVPVGAQIPLVIQVGKWRRQFLVPFNVQACTTQPITDASLLHLPRNQSEGDIPQMAIATGNADPFECLLLKMGVSTGEMTAPSGNGRIHFFRDPTNSSNGHNGGLQNSAGFLDVTQLVSDAGTLNKYDVVLLPCIGSEKFGLNPGNTQKAWTQNLINYTGGGGRLFTTHYGYVWMAFAQDPFPATARWTPDPNRNNAPADPFVVDVNQTFPKGAAFAQWLWDAGASTTFAKLDVHDPRHDVSGTDGGATTWLSGFNTRNDAGHSVQHLTFNTPYAPPALPDGDAGTQCGRVVFSNFHVTTSALITNGDDGTFPHDCAPGVMTAQEKALVFMLFDVSSCVQRDDQAPQLCKKRNDVCTRNLDCCAGLLCVDSSGNECFEGSCTCDVVIN
ncbi:MAG TPA: hypothetical protein VIG99_09105 [Myxococcaceae bacterium]